MKTPAILSLQETKFQLSGKHNLDGYISYEHLRTEKTAGGGLYMAFKTDLNPALARDGGEEVEAITVDISIKKMQIVCTTAYGPQEKDPREKKDIFWQFLEEEAKRAKHEGKGFILQGDLNSWLGNKYIPKDPRKQNENGKLFAGFIERNQLTVVNGLDLCKGVITRMRKSKDTWEKSILDFFVVCDSILSRTKGMVVDEDKKDILTNYTQVRKGGKAVDSDHMTVELDLDLKIIPTQPTRSILYNFKNEEARSLFKNLTSKSKEFTKCFDTVQTLPEQCDRWKKTLESYCKKSFPKIRIRPRVSQLSEATKLIDKRNILKKKKDDDKTSMLEDKELIVLETQIANILADEGRQKAYKFKKFCAQNGSVSVKEMWELKKHIWPKHKESIPTGKINHTGKLVTSPEDIKILMHKEFHERLRPRPIHPSLKYIEKLKHKTFKLKLEEAIHSKSPDWTMTQLNDVLKDINKNKARDPDGISQSIFHTDCIGSDLKDSLLVMFNEIKRQGTLPSFMKSARISTIPKSGSKFLLKNVRGIFVLSAVRNLLMRLLYNTKYETIDYNMSDSNVGGRKKRSSINHIFIINGIIHETLSSKKMKPVTLQIYDFKQMFDSMSLEESVSDLFDSGMNDDTLALIYDANKNINVKVKTPYGLCAENNFKEIVLQGDTWGPLMAANQVDTVAKSLLEENPEYIYKYKGRIPIGILGMIDDLAGVSESGVKAKQLNSFLNVKAAEKKLQFGKDKCHTLKIAHKNARNVESELFIDHWSEKHDKEGNLIEAFEGKVKMDQVLEQKYLGFIISEDGSNIKNILSKQKRSFGIIRDIKCLLTGLGK